MIRKVAPGHLVAGNFEALLYRKSRGEHVSGWIIRPLNRPEDATDRVATEREARECLADLVAKTHAC